MLTELLCPIILCFTKMCTDLGILLLKNSPLIKMKIDSQELNKPKELLPKELLPQQLLPENLNSRNTTLKETILMNWKEEISDCVLIVRISKLNLKMLKIKLKKMEKKKNNLKNLKKNVKKELMNKLRKKKKKKKR